MPLRYLDEPGPSLGMNRDQPSWLLPPGSVYDSLNLVYDQPGIARQRMGSTALVAGAQTAFASSLGFCYSTDSTAIEELYGCASAGLAVYLINKTNGANTSIGSISGTFPNVSRPVRHFGFLVFCGADSTTAFYRSQFVAGQTTFVTFGSTSAVTITAGQPQITLAGADTTTNMRVGGIIHAYNGTSNAYVGRIVSVDTATKFTVWPTPSITFVTGAANLFTAPEALQVGIDSNAYGGACVTSFQNRLLYGGVNAPGDATVTRHDRRVAYSPLPTENAISTSAPVITTNGAVFLAMSKWPALNYFDVPGADPIVAMEPISDNQLLILTSSHPVIFSGNLTTQLATTSPTITFDLSEINVSASCLSDLSVQRTPKGVVWAGAGGIYAWDGREPVDLTSGAMNTFWRGKVRGSSFAVHGSVYVRGYYILSYSSGGVTEAIAADLTGKAPRWTRMQGVGTDNFFGVARPTDPSQVFALRWWNTGGAAPSMTNGQTLRLESMLNPYTAGATTTDADGTAVTVSLTTRTITGDPELQKTFQRGTIRHQQSSTTAAVAVTAQSKIDAADISAASVRALGSLSNTSVLTVTNATNANPIVVTTSANHGLQSDDFVDIDGVTGNTNANGRWRIVSTGAATFSLVGGIGNGAFGGSPTCKKLTETDFQMSSLNSGQGVSLKFDGAPNNWQFHGARIAAMVRQPVMST